MSQDNRNSNEIGSGAVSGARTLSHLLARELTAEETLVVSGSIKKSPYTGDVYNAPTNDGENG